MHYLLLAAVEIPRVNKSVKNWVKNNFECEVYNAIEFLLDPYGSDIYEFDDVISNDFYWYNKQNFSDKSFDDFSQKTSIIIDKDIVHLRRADNKDWDNDNKDFVNLKFLRNCQSKRIYDVFDEFINTKDESKEKSVDDEYSYLYDWYEIGGRWENAFLVKEDCLECLDSDISCDIVGYKWVTAARKKDIDWEKTKQYRNIVPVGIISDRVCDVPNIHDLYRHDAWMPDGFIKRYNQFIDTLSDETVLVSVDCHV